MVFYHGTTTSGITILKPANENSNVYLTINKVLATFYIWDYQKAPWKWMTYRIVGNQIECFEYFKDCLKEFYDGVKGYLYSCEGDFELNDKKGLAAGVNRPVEITHCELVGNVYRKLLEYEQQGLLRIYRYDNLSEDQKQYIRYNVLLFMQNGDLLNKPENIYYDFVKRKFPDIWEDALLNTRNNI